MLLRGISDSTESIEVLTKDLMIFDYMTLGSVEALNVKP